MIRIATEKDAKEIAEIIKRHSETDYMGYVTFNESYVREKMKKDFYFVATEQNGAPPGKIVGCLRASIVDIDLAEIRTLCVDEEYRGNKIGSRLLENALKFLVGKGMRKVVTRTKSNNQIALGMFRKFGFEQEGYFKEHYRKGIDVIQLSKFL